ncbi:hypothetical protein U9M48_007740 [Paspalum notatum var. saurae]|uniref:Uncharacterized protein n=1 Tax=Paspalum notatum var. saurae TaxID=547442 RepID=A0AAQ3SMS8_PASNO
MQKQSLSHVSCPPPPDQESKKPSMGRQQGQATATGRSAGGDARPRTDAEDRPPVPSAPEDFEFCILSSGGLALAGDDAADMCVADEVFSDGKLLPLRLSSAKPADAPAALLLRSDSLDGAATAASSPSSGASSRSVSRSASSGSNSSSSSVSRSTSAKSAPPATAAVPSRRSLSSSVFYAHPSPSPRLPRRSGDGRRSAAAAAPRRSTGSAPPAAWGVLRLGVVGAPEVYAPRPAEYRRPAAAAARLERQRTAVKESERVPADKKLALGLLGAGLVCSCSPDAVAPVGSAEVAAAEARRRRKKAEEKKGAAAKQSGRSRILEWLEELSISKEKSVVV